MPNTTFIVGQDYSRRQIHEQLGGSLQSYLPTVDGAVVCACLRPDLNRRAPEVILVGFGSGIQRAGDMLIRQTAPIPVFIKRVSGCWTYRGGWSVGRRSQLPADIEQESGVTRRGTVSWVIFMERADR